MCVDGLPIVTAGDIAIARLAAAVGRIGCTPPPLLDSDQSIRCRPAGRISQPQLPPATAVAVLSPCMKVAKVRRDGRVTLSDGSSDDGRRRPLRSQPVDDRRRDLLVGFLYPSFGPLDSHCIVGLWRAPHLHVCIIQLSPLPSHPLTNTSLTAVVVFRPSTALLPSPSQPSPAAMSLGSAAAGGVASKKTPSDFLKSVLGRPVIVKLNSGVSYRGVLACLDGRFTRQTAHGQRDAAKISGESTHGR